MHILITMQLTGGEAIFPDFQDRLAIAVVGFFILAGMALLLNEKRKRAEKRDQ